MNEPLDLRAVGALLARGGASNLPTNAETRVMLVRTVGALREARAVLKYAHDNLDHHSYRLCERGACTKCKLGAVLAKVRDDVQS